MASPLPGRLIPLSEVPDPVFAKGLVGGGAAVIPDDDAGVLTAVAPLDGKVIKVMPHAYIVQHASGPAVLVHVGIDTVGLKGEGFSVLAQKGDQVRAGDPMISVDVTFVRSKNLSMCSPVVILDSAADAIALTGIAAPAWKPAGTCSTCPDNRAMDTAGELKHVWVRRQLQDLVATTLRPGDALLGERQLEEQFGVSRITVRRAISDLVQDGALVRIKGKGTFVSHGLVRSTLHLASFNEDMRAAGFEPSTRVITPPRRSRPPRRPSTWGCRRGRRPTRSAGCAWPTGRPSAWTNPGCRPGSCRTCSRRT